MVAISFEQCIRRHREWRMPADFLNYHATPQFGCADEVIE